MNNIIVGDKVITTNDFTNLADAWGYTYPSLNEVVTVSAVDVYNGRVKEFKCNMLSFEEYPNLPPVCEYQYDGKTNFKLI